MSSKRKKRLVLFGLFAVLAVCGFYFIGAKYTAMIFALSFGLPAVIYLYVEFAYWITSE